MHQLFVAVLHRKDLSKAGELFSLEDAFVVQDIQQVLSNIQDIITQTHFLSSHNEQSLVEICITRLTSAIRETRSIEQHAKSLVALLETCLVYNLRPVHGGPDPPHAKFASDVMSCLFLNYAKKSVMQLALPVSVKFLHKGNKDLSRNLSSYFSLAAIDNADLLAQHIQPIIDSVISGNYTLARVLPQIYSVNKDPIINHVMVLVSILPNCEQTEMLALLSLFAHIAKDSPAHLEPSIPQLCECLTSPSTAQATLQVLYNIALSRPLSLTDHTEQFMKTAENFPKTALLSIQLLSLIAKAKQDKAQTTLEFILSVVFRMDGDQHSNVLKEVISLTGQYPLLLTTNLINKVSALDEGTGVNSATKACIQELKNEFNQSHFKNQDKLTINSRHPSHFVYGSMNMAGHNTNAVTVVRVGNGGSRTDDIYSYSRPSVATSCTPSTPVSMITVAANSAAVTVTTTCSSSGAEGSRPDLRDKCGVTRVPTHRSMTKLNSTPTQISSVLDNKIGLHKSMSKLNSSQSNIIGRHSSSSQTVVVTTSGLNMATPAAARSVTCIHGTSRHTLTTGSATPSACPISLCHASTYLPPYNGATSKLTLNLGPGSTSPTKSMSSGSMSTGIMDAAGREVLTVNVNQINQDLIRQVSSVMSHHDISSLLLPPSSSIATSSSGFSNPIPSATQLASSASITTNSQACSAPFSLPTHTSRRLGTYSSGPLLCSSSQPPSLGIPSSSAVLPTVHGSNIGGITSKPSSHVSSQPLSINGLIYPNSASTARKNMKNRCSQGGTSTRAFSNTLPSPRKRQELKALISDAAEEEECVHTNPLSPPLTANRDHVDNVRGNRVSVFEPYPMRDTVQHFCEKHLDKIKGYMESLCVKLPLPVKCTIEERKGRKHAKLHFACQGRTGEHCLYKYTFYTLKTRNPRTWIHLMFLALQARSSSAISTRETSVSALKNCWEILKYENLSFVTLVTGAFPSAKCQDSLLHELRSHRFFDVFEYNGPLKIWGCFLCNHPDRATIFIEEQEPVIEGQLKEKKGGKWRLFTRWKNRYFTLSGAKLSYKDVANGEPGTVTQSLDVGSIRSVKVSKEGRRNIPKAFEIFTADKTFVLKAKDGSNAQEWVQCLSVAKAHSQARDPHFRETALGGSLGRLHQHGRVSAMHHHHSNMAIRTNV